jgi:restriction system protein
VAIPDFQTIMRPLLQAYADGLPKRIAEAEVELGESFGLTPDELAELLPSGKQQKFKNRVRWSATYLKNAGALERLERGLYRISQRGRDLLEANPASINIATLNQFEEFRAFHSGSGGNETPGLTTGEEPATPEEQIASAASALRQALIADLRDRIAAMTPVGFELLVLDVLAAMGYGASGSQLRTGGSGDAGIDGVIEEDRLGLDVIYVQAKKWTDPVQRPAVQGFVGALQGARATKGIMFTSSSFSRGAEEYAANVSPRVILVDGQRLAALMIDHDVGVSTREVLRIKNVDSDYFGDEA